MSRLTNITKSKLPLEAFNKGKMIKDRNLDELVTLIREEVTTCEDCASDLWDKNVETCLKSVTLYIREHLYMDKELLGILEGQLYIIANLSKYIEMLKDCTPVKTNYEQSILDLQEKLIIEKAAEKDMFKRKYGKKDMPFSQKRYFVGQQDMLDKVKAIMEV